MLIELLEDWRYYRRGERIDIPAYRARVLVREGVARALDSPPKDREIKSLTKSKRREM